MDVKIAICLISILSAGDCLQIDNQNLIEQTKHLQDIEKYGWNYSNYSKPVENNNNPLTNHTGSTHDLERSNKTTVPFHPHNNSTSSQPSFNSTERFLNKTIAGMSKGVCIKEVSTASLLQKNQVLVAGNGSDPSLSRIQVCCEGYQRNMHNFRKCDPICKDECINGFCAAPDTCVCYPDHVRNFGGFCLPTCPIGCGNGICRDNMCVCKEGFSLEPLGKFCVPVCSGGCPFGNCTAPETCSCNKGFSLSSDGKCEPVCSKGCKNGNCVAPEVCNCSKGYTVVNGECQPVCSKGCLNGICIAPEQCQCPGNGWTLDSTGAQCVASCDKPCLNGKCSGPNKCSCNDGYSLDILDTFRCIPQCNPPCINGVCSRPNMCLCSPGFIKVNGNCRKRVE